MLKAAQGELRLQGRTVRLEPLGEGHAGALTAAAAGSAELYRWTVVPQSHEAMLAYVRKGLAARAGGTATPFAIVRQALAADGTVRDTARYSILAEEWPALKVRLEERLARPA